MPSLAPVHGSGVLPLLLKPTLSARTPVWHPLGSSSSFIFGYSKKRHHTRWRCCLCGSCAICTACFVVGFLWHRLVEVQEKLGATLAELDKLRESNESLRSELDKMRKELEDKEAATHQELQVKGRKKGASTAGVLLPAF